MQRSRRRFIKALFQTGTASILWTSGLSSALSRPKADSPLHTLFKGQDLKPTSEILLTLPAVIEASDQIPVLISSKLKKIENVWLIAENNPSPLLAKFMVHEQPVWIRTNIRLAKSGPLHVVAELDKNHFIHHKIQVKISHSGCL